MKKTLLILGVFACVGASAQISSFPYLEDFEAGQGGWTIDNTVNGSWAFGTPAMAVIAGASSGVNAFATGNLTGLYNVNEASFVESPIFDCSSLTGTEVVSLRTWWESENSWDGSNLHYSTDAGATWTLLGNFGDPDNWYTDNLIDGAPGGSQEGWTGRNGGGSNGWVTSKQPLVAAIYGATDVRFRVYFGSDGSVTDDGFAFDDFSIFIPPLVDYAMVSIDSLTLSGCGLGLQDVYASVIENGPVGLGIGDSLFFTYNDGTTSISDTVILTAAIPPAGTYQHQFSQQADFTVIATYNITVTVGATLDAVLADNTMTATVVSSPTITTLPYFEDFELGQGGWAINNNANGSWAFGTPANAIVGAASGVNAFAVANLTGTYNGNEDGFVESPCFDLSGTVGDESVALSINHVSENSWDGANLQSTNDGGVTWNLVGNFGDPGNWYNDNSINGSPGGSGEGWTNNSGGWISACHTLSANELGQASVRFRVYFGSDGSVNQDGFAFDNFAIGSGPAFDPFADTLTLCDTIFTGDAGV
ncbi:MAG: hypothetical protein JKY54_10230 [Flavobacteriales bacterium]|nr:hypothetical protein [Flavobacteriales bacterium]